MFPAAIRLSPVTIWCMVEQDQGRMWEAMAEHGKDANNREQLNGTEILTSVGEWFDLASTNAAAAVLLSSHQSLRRQSLYMTQQSMETATKGLARARGVPHEQFRKWGHNNLNLFIWVVNEVVTTTGSAPFIDAILSTDRTQRNQADVVTRLQDMFNLTASPKDAMRMGSDIEGRARAFYESMLLLPPQAVILLTGILIRASKFREDPNIAGLVAALTKSPFVLESPSAGEDFVESLTQQVLSQCQSRGATKSLNEEQKNLLASLAPQVIRNSIPTDGEQQFRLEIETSRQEYSWSREAVEASIELPMAFVGLLIIGGLVWPHESYTRYVAPPGAPSDIAKAAAQQPRLLGSRHYTVDLGVIRYIRRIAGLAKRTSDLLSEGYSAGYILPTGNAT